MLRKTSENKQGTPKPKALPLKYIAPRQISPPPQKKYKGPWLRLSANDFCFCVPNCTCVVLPLQHALGAGQPGGKAHVHNIIPTCCHLKRRTFFLRCMVRIRKLKTSGSIQNMQSLKHSFLVLRFPVFFAWDPTVSTSILIFFLFVILNPHLMRTCLAMFSELILQGILNQNHLVRSVTFRHSPFYQLRPS